MRWWWFNYSNNKCDILKSLISYILSYNNENDTSLLICVGIVFCLAWLQTFHHVYNWNNPKEQKVIIALSFMPYCVAFGSLALLSVFYTGIYDSTSLIYIDSLNQCIAGLFIPLFTRLIFTYMDINHNINSGKDIRLLIGHRIIRNIFPVTLIQPPFYRLNVDNLKYIKLLTWQFVVIRLVSSLLMIALHFYGIYPVWLSWLFSLIFTASVSLAFYTMLIFSQSYIQELELHLLYFKLFHVVAFFFVCFCQRGIFRALLFAMRIIIKSNDFWVDVPTHFHQLLHCFLLVLEMLVLASFQTVVYSALPYTGPTPTHGILPIIRKPRPPPNPKPAPDPTSKPEVKKESLRSRINL